ncbi:MAG: hypothetical protein ACLGHN_05845 [Bacteriovoracia bacterium]
MKFKFLIPLTILTLSSFSYAQTNLSDAIDENEVEAEKERRANEVINQPDSMDENTTPSTLEERQREEEWREDYDENQEDYRIEE